MNATKNYEMGDIVLKTPLTFQFSSSLFDLLLYISQNLSELKPIINNACLPKRFDYIHSKYIDIDIKEFEGYMKGIIVPFSIPDRECFRLWYRCIPFLELNDKHEWKFYSGKLSIPHSCHPNVYASNGQYIALRQINEDDSLSQSFLSLEELSKGIYRRDVFQNFFSRESFDLNTDIIFDDSEDENCSTGLSTKLECNCDICQSEKLISCPDMFAKAMNLLVQEDSSISKYTAETSFNNTSIQYSDIESNSSIEEFINKVPTLSNSIIERYDNAKELLESAKKYIDEYDSLSNDTKNVSVKDDIQKVLLPVTCQLHMNYSYLLAQVTTLFHKSQQLLKKAHELKESSFILQEKYQLSESVSERNASDLYAASAQRLISILQKIMHSENLSLEKDGFHALAVRSLMYMRRGLKYGLPLIKMNVAILDHLATDTLNLLASSGALIAAALITANKTTGLSLNNQIHVAADELLKHVNDNNTFKESREKSIYLLADIVSEKKIIASESVARFCQRLRPIILCSWANHDDNAGFNPIFKCIH